MATVTIAVFDNKPAAETFAGSFPKGTDLRKYGPLSDFAFDQNYGGAEEPTITNPGNGLFHIVIVKL